MIENLIELKNVSKKFKDKTEEIIILNKISIKLPANKLVALTGPSGSGKSTLIHLLALLDTPEQGEYNILTSGNLFSYDEKQKSSKGAMDMLKTPKSVEADGMKAAKDTAANIAKSAPGRKMRNNDKKDGDNTIIPAATPVKDPAAKMQTAESYGISGSKLPSSLLDAIDKVTEIK